MGEVVVLEGKSEHGSEFIRHIITSGVMEMKIVQLIFINEGKNRIIGGNVIVTYC